MSRKHPIDELFRSKLENHAFEPPMQLWDNIDQKRNRRKAIAGRFGYTRILVLAGLLLAGGVAAWFAFQPFGEKAVPKATPETNSVTENSAQQAIALNDNDDAEVSNSLIGEESQEIQTTVNSELDQVSHIEISSGEESDKPSVASQSEKEKLPVKQLAIADQQLSVATSETGQNNIENDIDNTLNPSTISDISSVIDEQEGLNNPDNKVNLFERSKVVDYLPLKSKLLSKNTDSPEFKETDCPTFKGLPKGLYLDANASVDLAQRSMTTRNPEFDDYLKEREKTEIPYFAFSTGLHLTLLSERGFALKTGVDYTQITESFNFESGEIEVIIIVNGDTTREVKNMITRATNRYQLVDIPLLAGYEHNFSNFSLSVYGGPFFNVMFAKKGNYISSQTNQPVGTTTGEPDKFAEIFRPKLGLGWYTSFGFGYKLQRGTQIRVEPYFRFYPKSFSASNHVIDQRYFLTGLKIGIRKKL